MCPTFRQLQTKALRASLRRMGFPVAQVDYTTRAKPKRQRVAIGSLTATQDSVHAGYRSQKNPTKGPISVFRGPKGRLYIIEGHHRTARAKARGDKRIEALVYREP